jgi:hypothetical protein
MHSRFASFILLVATLVLSAGCEPKSEPDPVAGWKKFGSFAGFPATDTGYRLDATIMADYQAYISSLSPDEKAETKSGALLYFCEDGNGQHAIQVVMAINGNYWTHVLIYDKSNKRVKLIKYRSGRYSC